MLLLKTILKNLEIHPTIFEVSNGKDAVDQWYYSTRFNFHGHTNAHHERLRS
jgi:hypothetical protein